MSERRYFCTHCDRDHMTEEQARYHATMAHGFAYRMPLPDSRHWPLFVTWVIFGLSAALVSGALTALIVSVI